MNTFEEPKQTLLLDNKTDLDIAIEEAIKSTVKSSSVYEWLLDPLATKPEILDLIAKEYGVLDWYESYEVEDKRNAVLHAPMINQHSGTREGLRVGLEALGYGFEFTPWYEMTPKGKPYEFKLVSWRNNTPITKELFDRVVRRIDNVKSERDTVDLYLAVGMGAELVTSGAVSHDSVESLDCYGDIFDDTESRGGVYIGAAIHSLLVNDINCGA